MPESFLPKIDLESFASTPSAFDHKALSYFKRVHAILNPQNIDLAFQYLQQTIGLYESSFDVSNLLDLDDVIALLDSGACAIFASEQQVAQLHANRNIDRSRIVLSVEVDSNESALKGAHNAIGSIHLTGINDVTSLREHLATHKRKDDRIYVTLSEPKSEAVFEAVKLFAIPVIDAAALTIDSKRQPNLLSAAELILANATSDREDGLLSTIVTDERGVALGLVYSSTESVSESLRTGSGVYQSRKRGLWYKGATSGDTQELVSLKFDCDNDCMVFTVRQKGRGFCHLGTATCFGPYRGLSKLQQTLRNRKLSAPEGSYTARLFNDPQLLQAKIREEADELCDATEKNHIAFEAADLIYFAMTKCVAAGVGIEDIENALDAKSLIVKRRRGDAKAPYVNGTSNKSNGRSDDAKMSPPKSDSKDMSDFTLNRIQMMQYDTSQVSQQEIHNVLQRPSQRSTEKIMGIVKPIIESVRTGGDSALLSFTHKFDKATSLKSPVIHAPFPESLMQLPQETIDAIDISFENIRRFHAAQREEKPLSVETMPGVICSRFSRPIDRVGLYIPGGTAVLPSTALMLGVPAMVAGCRTIVLASPPRPDGSITPEIAYIAHKVGATSIVLAGGAQAVAALAYGTESVHKVDKIIGPGNQFVTAAKMLVSNDTSAGVSIDMPAGPSEVLVVADGSSNPAFVASDLLSQAEHGTDSQVILIAVAMSPGQVAAVEDELHAQASALPRVDIVRGAIDHSVTLLVSDIAEAMRLSNQYAPEHLILQCADADHAATLVENAGSVFIGPWTPESVGDYSAGVNHSLPTYGYARQYSGVNLGSYVKHITSSKLTAQGLRNVGGAVMQMAKVEELEAHRRAVQIRWDWMDKNSLDGIA